MKSLLFFTTCKTNAGWIGFMGTEKGLCAITFPQSTKDKALAQLGADITTARESDSAFEDAKRRLLDYFSGKEKSFPDKLDFGKATAFQRSVWQAAQEIPYGQTRSYGWIAKKIGKPGAARAVGQALGRNPLPIIVPCHRVVAANGGLGGFSGGLETKKWLLKLEKTKL